MATEPYSSNTPENTSLLQLTKFTFIFPDKPFLKYYCQTAQIPSISTSEIEIATPFSSTYRHGEKLSYDPLTVSALVDEDMRVFEETYNWLKALTRPHSFDEYPRKSIKDPQAPLYFDAYLTATTNAHNPNIRFKFYNCHPTTIGAINFDTKTDPDNIPTMDVTFRFDTFELQRINAITT